MYRLSWANKARVEAAAVRANLRRPRAFWDDNLNACVSGYDNRDRRIRLSARTVIDLLGALKDAAARGGF